LQYYYATYQGLFPVFDRLNNFYSSHNILASNDACNIDPAIH